MAEYQRMSIYKASKKAAFIEHKLNTGEDIIVFDLETTGLKRKTDRIVSLAALKVGKKNGIYVLKGKLDLLINPGFPIPPAASKVNGITNATVAKCKNETELFPKIYEFFGDTPNLCGYNSARFDEGFIKDLYERNGKTLAPAIDLDVMEMAKENLDLQNYTLESVAHELGVDNGISYHNAMDDVKATYRCMQILRAMYNENKPKKFEPVTVQECRYWRGASHYLDRVYLTTIPRGQTYYDIYKKEWKTNIENANLDDIRRDALYLVRAKDEKEMVTLLKNQQTQKGKQTQQEGAVAQSTTRIQVTELVSPLTRPVD